MEPSKRWSAEDLDFLCESWGSLSIPMIAKKLNRSTRAVQKMASKKKLGSFLANGDYITLGQLASLLSGREENKATMKKRMVRRGLPIKWQKVNQKGCYVVSIDDFWNWAEDNKPMLDLSLLDHNIMGPEPEWAAEKRRDDKFRNANRKGRMWSVKEIAYLEDAAKNGLSTREIAYALNRSQEAVQSQMVRMRVNTRISNKNQAHKLWHAKDLILLEKYVASGKTVGEIAAVMGRTPSSIRGKLSWLYGTTDIAELKSILEGGYGYGTKKKR